MKSSKLISQLVAAFNDSQYDEQYFQRKLDFLEANADLEYAQKIFDAFLLPLNQDLLQTHKSALQSFLDEQSIELAMQSAVYCCNKKQLKLLQAIKNPEDNRADLVRLVLLYFYYEIQVGHQREYANAFGELVTDIANNFGFWQIRYRLENSMFELIDPENFALVCSLVQKTQKKHQDIFDQIEIILQNVCTEHGIRNFQIAYRQKHEYGIFHKMQCKKKNINQITDFFACRIITKDEADCRKVVSLLHELWPHLDGRYKDYITSPKANNYQSIHTTLLCLEKLPVEFQVRSKAMDQIAHHGHAKHSEYKKQM